MSRIAIDIILWLSLLTASHHHFQLKLHKIPTEQPPIVSGSIHF